MLASASIFKACDGIAVDVVGPFMALLSFRGIDTPSLAAQGEQRRLSLFNIPRDNSMESFRSRLRDRLAHHIYAGVRAEEVAALAAEIAKAKSKLDYVQ